MCIILITSQYIPISIIKGCPPFSSVQFISVAQLCPTLCDPMNHSTPGLPVHHQTPRVHPNSCPLSPWCHPAISSSVIPFSSCLQSLSASESFPMSQLLFWSVINLEEKLFCKMVAWPFLFLSSNFADLVWLKGKGKCSWWPTSLYIIYSLSFSQTHISCPVLFLPSATATLVVLLFFEQTGCAPFENASTLSSGFLDGSVVKNPPANAEASGDMGSILGSEDSLE